MHYRVQVACGVVCALQDKGRMFREAFLGKLSLLLRGTVAAPADRFGETLADEHMMGGEPAVVTTAHCMNMTSKVWSALCCSVARMCTALVDASNSTVHHTYDG